MASDLPTRLLCITLACAASIPGAVAAQEGAAQEGAASDYDRVDREATVLRTLREGIHAENDGVQHAAMVALRDLRDPALKPLFERLADSDAWMLRVDSVLAMAELSEPGVIDLARLEQLPGERDREAAIVGAIALRLASTEQVAAMLGWSDLASSQRVLLAGELRRLGGTPETAMLVRLANSRTPEVAGIAISILLDMKAREAEPLAPKVRELVAGLPTATRSAAVAQIADACAAYRLAGAGPFIASLLELPELSEESRMRALGNLLIFAPESAYGPLAAILASDSSQSSLFRYSSILIASGAKAPSDVWSRFRNGDSMMESIADAGLALADGRLVDGYATLVGLERRVLLRAAVDGAQRMGIDAEIALGRECLQFVLKPGPTPPQLTETLLASLMRLATLDPGQFKTALTTADLDMPTRDALLMSLLNAGSREAADAARSVRGTSSRFGEGQIAVLSARHAATLAPAELEELMLVAGGASNVAFGVRMQAAWLWLRHSGKAGAAIEALAPARTSAPPAG